MWAPEENRNKKRKQLFQLVYGKKYPKPVDLFWFYITKPWYFKCKQNEYFQNNIMQYTK